MAQKTPTDSRISSQPRQDSEERTLPDAGLAEACRRIIAHQNTAIMIRSTDMRPLYINSAYERLFDISLDEWKQGDLTSHLGPNAQDILNEEIIPALQQGQRWFGELEVCVKGRTKHVLAEFNNVPASDENTAYFFGTYKEISQLKKLEQSLLHQVDFLNNILDTMADPVFVKDEHLAWVVTNKAFCELSGLGREELLGKTDADFFPRKEAAVFNRQDKLALTSEEPVSNEETLTSRRGQTHILSTKKTSFTQKDGQKFMVGMARIVTEERRLEQSMALSYHQLESTLTGLQSRLLGIQDEITYELNKTDAIQKLINRSSEDFLQYLQNAGLEPAREKPATQETPLSHREYQVFLLLAQGMRVKDVAHHLELNPNTVSTYRARIMKKLRLSSLTELIQYAMRRGMI